MTNLRRKRTTSKRPKLGHEPDLDRLLGVRIVALSDALAAAGVRVFNGKATDVERQTLRRILRSSVGMHAPGDSGEAAALVFALAEWIREARKRGESAAWLKGQAGIYDKRFDRVQLARWADAIEGKGSKRPPLVRCAAELVREAGISKASVEGLVRKAGDVRRQAGRG